MQFFTRRSFLSLFGAVFSAGLFVSPGAAQELEKKVAGTVAKLQGSAIAIQDATPRALKVGAEILIGDVVSTGADSRLELRMIDDGLFTLGERTNFVVMEYRFDDNSGNAATRLLDGTVRAITGKIAQLTGQPFRMDTEFASIGVRGTEFWGGPLDGVMQFALLGGGGIIVSNGAGSVEITEEGHGTWLATPLDAPAAPDTWGDDKIKRALETVTFQ